MSDLRHVVHSVSGTDDPYFSIEFAIRMYFLANYIEGLELRDARQTAQIAELEEEVLDADEKYTNLANHEESMANELRKSIAESEEHVLDAEAEYFHIAERLDAKEQEVSEYKACCEGLLNLLLMVNKTNMTLLLEKCEYKEVITEAGDFIERLIETGNKLASMGRLKGFFGVEDWKKLVSEWEDGE